MKKSVKATISICMAILFLAFSILSTNCDFSEIAITVEATTKSNSVKKPNFSVTTGDKQVVVSWKKVNEATKYYVYCYTGEEKVSITSTTKTTLTIDKLNNGVQYKFLVVSVNGDKKSEYTDNDWIYAIPNKGKITELDKPIVTVSQSKTKICTINTKWTKVANATSYVVYYKQKSDKKYTKAATVTGSSFAIELSTFIGSEYTVKVKAIYKDIDNKTISATSSGEKIKVKSAELTPSEFSQLMNAFLNTDMMKSVYGDVKISCRNNKLNIYPYDIKIEVYSQGILDDLLSYSYVNNITDKDKQYIITKNVSLQYIIYYYANELMPNKKIQGGFYTDYYKYPNLKIDLITIDVFTWVNYSYTDPISFDYKSTKYTGKMKWDAIFDESSDYGIKLKQSDITFMEKTWKDIMVE
jgi:hypothetical protein